jgi:hypothetical protein
MQRMLSYGFVDWASGDVGMKMWQELPGRAFGQVCLRNATSSAATLSI